MNVYIYSHKDWGRAFTRINNALKKYKPANVELVDSPNKADVSIINIVGAAEAAIYNSTPGDKVIIQHCYFTGGYNLVDFPSLWESSRCTISFHPLNTYTDKKFKFHHTPWGYEPSEFRYINFGGRNNKIFTTGHVSATECIDKIYEACRLLNVDMHHTGENFKFGSNYKFHEYFGDKEFLTFLNTVQYVAGLRLVEGFEMHCVEGLACGAVPIVPDLPTYQWYKDMAYMVDTNKDIVQQLTDILKNPPGITPKLNEVRDRFSWESVAPAIWRSIL